ADANAEAETGPGMRYDPEFKADPGLLDRLRATEAEGVLADMVEHAAKFYRAGRTLSVPAEVTAATIEYRKAEDLIGQFFEARVRDDPDGRVKASALHSAFRQWWEGEGYLPNKCPGPKKF